MVTNADNDNPAGLSGAASITTKSRTVEEPKQPKIESPEKEPVQKGSSSRILGQSISDNLYTPEELRQWKQLFEDKLTSILARTGIVQMGEGKKREFLFSKVLSHKHWATLKIGNRNLSSFPNGAIVKQIRGKPGPRYTGAKDLRGLFNLLGFNIASPEKEKAFVSSTNKKNVYEEIKNQKNIWKSEVEKILDEIVKKVNIQELINDKGQRVLYFGKCKGFQHVRDFQIGDKCLTNFPGAPYISAIFEQEDKRTLSTIKDLKQVLKFLGFNIANQEEARLILDECKQDEEASKRDLLEKQKPIWTSQLLDNIDEVKKKTGIAEGLRESTGQRIFYFSNVKEQGKWKKVSVGEKRLISFPSASIIKKITGSSRGSLSHISDLKKLFEFLGLDAATAEEERAYQASISKKSKSDFEKQVQLFKGKWKKLVEDALKGQEKETGFYEVNVQGQKYWLYKDGDKKEIDFKAFKIGAIPAYRFPSSDVIRSIFGSKRRYLNGYLDLKKMMAFLGCRILSQEETAKYLRDEQAIKKSEESSLILKEIKENKSRWKDEFDKILETLKSKARIVELDNEQGQKILCFFKAYGMNKWRQVSVGKRKITSFPNARIIKTILNDESKSTVKTASDLKSLMAALGYRVATPEEEIKYQKLDEAKQKEEFLQKIEVMKPVWKAQLESVIDLVKSKANILEEEVGGEKIYHFDKCRNSKQWGCTSVGNRNLLCFPSREVIRFILGNSEAKSMTRPAHLKLLFEFLGFKVAGQRAENSLVNASGNKFSPGAIREAVKNRHSLIRRGERGEDYAEQYLKDIGKLNVRRVPSYDNSGYCIEYNEPNDDTTYCVEVTTTTSKISAKRFTLTDNQISTAEEIQKIPGMKYQVLIVSEFQPLSGTGKVDIIDFQDVEIDEKKMLKVALDTSKADIIFVKINDKDSKLFSDLSSKNEISWSEVFKKLFLKRNFLPLKGRSDEAKKSDKNIAVEIWNKEKEIDASLQAIKDSKLIAEKLKDLIYRKKYVDCYEDFSRENHEATWRGRNSLYDSYEYRIRLNLNAQRMIDEYLKRKGIVAAVDFEYAEGQEKYDFSFVDSTGKRVFIDVKASSYDADEISISCKKLKQIKKLDSQNCEYHLFNVKVRPDSQNLVIDDYNMTSGSDSCIKSRKRGNSYIRLKNL